MGECTICLSFNSLSSALTFEPRHSETRVYTFNKLNLSNLDKWESLTPFPTTRLYPTILAKPLEKNT